MLCEYYNFKTSIKYKKDIQDQELLYKLPYYESKAILLNETKFAMIPSIPPLSIPFIH